MEDDQNNFQELNDFMKEHYEKMRFQPQKVLNETLELLDQKEYKQATEHLKNSNFYKFPPVFESEAKILTESKKTERLNALSWEVNEKIKENNHLRDEYFSMKDHADELTKQRSELEKKYNDLLSKTQETNIKDLVPGYVDDVTKKLLIDAQEYQNNSIWWVRGGVLCIALAIIFNVCSIKYYPDIANLNTVQTLFLFTRGVVVIGLLCWVAHFCFSMAKNFTGQLIRRKDTMHSIRFGELFLKIFGSSVTKEETVNVFKEWNNSGITPFSDPVKEVALTNLKDTLENAIDVTKGVADVVSKVKSNK